MPDIFHFSFSREIKIEKKIGANIEDLRSVGGVCRNPECTMGQKPGISGIEILDN